MVAARKAVMRRRRVAMIEERKSESLSTKSEPSSEGFLVETWKCSVFIRALCLSFWFVFGCLPSQSSHPDLEVEGGGGCSLKAKGWKRPRGSWNKVLFRWDFWCFCVFVSDVFNLVQTQTFLGWSDNSTNTCVDKANPKSLELTSPSSLEKVHKLPAFLCLYGALCQVMPDTRKWIPNNVIILIHCHLWLCDMYPQMDDD